MVYAHVTPILKVLTGLVAGCGCGVSLSDFLCRDVGAELGPVTPPVGCWRPHLALTMHRRMMARSALSSLVRAAFRWAVGGLGALYLFLLVLWNKQGHRTPPVYRANTRASCFSWGRGARPVYRQCARQCCTVGA